MRRYYDGTNQGFADKHAERHCPRERVKKFAGQLQSAALRKLALLDAKEIQILLGCFKSS